MNRLPVTAAALVLAVVIWVLVGEALSFGPWAWFLTGALVMLLVSLTDREAFYGPSPRSRR